MRTALLSLTFTVLLALAAAGVAFVAGRSAADAPAAYARGLADGERRASARAEADTAVAARKAAYAAGRRAGIAEGARKGRARGRTAVFAGFEGGWDVGRWYLVNIAPAKDGDGVAIGSRIALRRAQWYGLCARPSGLCRKVDADARERAAGSTAAAAARR